MPIVTLTSDFGLADYYVAVLKGGLLEANDSLTLVDISHNVENYDIVQAAFMVKNAYHHFPEGTIHIISVTNHSSPKSCFLVARLNDHYFIAPDNGVLYLMFGDELKDIYEIEQPRHPTTLKAIYSKAVKHIAGALPFNEIGIPIESIDQKIQFQPVISKAQIRGSVIYVDQYENAIVNINQELFDSVRKGRYFSISFKGHTPIHDINEGYADVPIGEPVCFFNEAGYLEIAINMGKAGSLLGLQKEESVHIDFIDN